MPDKAVVETIRSNAKESDGLEGELKTLKGELKDIIEGDSKFEDFDNANAEFKHAKEELRLSLMANNRYNEIQEKIAQRKEDLADVNDVLSTYLIEYYAETHEPQIEIDESNGDAREVIVKGKLGKKQKYQNSLFAGRLEKKG